MKGWQLKKFQTLAMLTKKGVTSIRSWKVLLIQILAPTIFIILTLLTPAATVSDLKVQEFSLDHYDRPVTVLSGSDNDYKTAYRNILKDNNHIMEDIGNGNLAEYILQKTKEITSTVRHRYILATSFEENSITALFNNIPYHSPPLAVSMVFDSIVRTKLNSSYKIHITNHPLPISIDSKVSNSHIYSKINVVCFRLMMPLVKIAAVTLLA